MDIFYFLKFSNFSIVLIWLTVILLSLAKNKNIKLKWIKYGIAITAIFYIAIGSYGTVVTYNLWKNDPVSKYLLPPYQQTYFYQYAFFHFWLVYVLNFLAAFFWLIFLFLLKKYSQNRFLDKNDVWLGFLAAFALDWHYFLVYSVLVFALPIAFQIANKFILKKESLVSITHSLIIGALIIMIFGNFLIGKLNVLKIA